MTPGVTSQVSIGVHPALAPWAPEVKYAFRVLMRIAGLPYRFVWHTPGEGPTVDMYYGPSSAASRAAISIHTSGMPFNAMSPAEPDAVIEHDGVPYLYFSQRVGAPLRVGEEGQLIVASDIVFSAFWLLAGAAELTARRDRWDNLDLEGSPLIRESLLERPAVSLYGALLGARLRGPGREPMPQPWAEDGSAVAFVLSHDVDYPEMIRWIECLRAVGTRGLAGFGLAAAVLRGRSHFWKFRDWVEYERSIGARSAFYFMSRRGSLARYAAGTPDAFYDIRTPEFRRLFRELRDAGCEIGLHASFHAYRSVEQLRREKDALEAAAEVAVVGNRHHYWHLDPGAPHETIRHQERAGFQYDSSLALEFYPGFRRGICHPFRPYDPEQRRELGVVELPPAWMDDHFGRRQRRNGIEDAEGHARKLMGRARETGGVVVVDYHVRGMNSEFFPRYGPWLVQFLSRYGSPLAFRTPAEVVRGHLEHERELEACSRDETAAPHPVQVVSPSRASHEVEYLAEEGEERWDRFVAEHPGGTLYQTLAWRAVVAEGLGHRPYFLQAMEGDRTISGVFPLFLVRGPFGRRLVGVPMRDRGGLLAREPDAAAALIGRATELARELRCRYLMWRSLEPLDQSLERELGLRCLRSWVTTRIDLTVGAEALWQALDKDAVRWAVRKAEKHGLRMEIDASQEGIEEFYRLFVSSRRALGIPPFPQALFVAIWRHLIATGRANLFLVRHGDLLVHGMVNFFWRDTFVPAYVATRYDRRGLHANELMLWRTIRWAAEAGFAVYDFGADSPHQTTLHWAKRKWGGLHHPVHYYYHLPGGGRPPHFDSSAAHYRSLRAAWRLLPTGASALLGGWLTRQLS